MKVEEPDYSYTNYTYADYFKWQLKDRVELIKGKIFKMSPAPNVQHQRVSRELGIHFYNYLKPQKCEVFFAPFDVLLELNALKNTVVQPDICVVCDPNKIDKQGCIGPPDLIVEILSPGNNAKELKTKYDLYEEAGVKEYWIIQPNEQTLIIYTLKDGKYLPSKLLSTTDRVNSEVLPDLELRLEEIFVE